MGLGSRATTKPASRIQFAIRNGALGSLYGWMLSMYNLDHLRKPWSASRGTCCQSPLNKGMLHRRSAKTYRPSAFHCRIVH